MIESKPARTEYREIWKPIQDTNEMYYVSDRGRVYSKHTNKILSLYIDRGYARIKIAKKNYRLHRLVMKTFKPIENSNELTVNHLDLDKLNNCITNLEWCSQKENLIHYYKNRV